MTFFSLPEEVTTSTLFFFSSFRRLRSPRRSLRSPLDYWNTNGRLSWSAIVVWPSSRVEHRPHPLHFDRVGGRYVGGGAFLDWELVASFHIHFQLYYERIALPHWWPAPFGRRHWPDSAQLVAVLDEDQGRLSGRTVPLADRRADNQEFGGGDGGGDEYAGRGAGWGQGVAATGDGESGQDGRAGYAGGGVDGCDGCDAGIFSDAVCIHSAGNTGRVRGGARVGISKRLGWTGGGLFTHAGRGRSLGRSDTADNWAESSAGEYAGRVVGLWAQHRATDVGSGNGGTL